MVAEDGDREAVVGEMHALDGRGTVSDDVAETCTDVHAALHGVVQCGPQRNGVGMDVRNYGKLHFPFPLISATAFLLSSATFHARCRRWHGGCRQA